jgi:hypothetical protein
MDGFLLICREATTDLPISLHASQEAAIEAASRLTQNKVNRIRGQLSWGGRGAMAMLGIIEFVGGKPFTFVRVEEGQLCNMENRGRGRNFGGGKWK